MTETLVLEQKESLTDLAQEINKEHHLCDESLKAGLEHAMSAGKLLIRAKEQMKHGDWLNWLKENCECSERTAQAYMRVVRLLPTLPEGKAQRVADLSFREVIKEIGREVRLLKSVPDGEQDEILRSAEGGEKTISEGLLGPPDRAGRGAARSSRSLVDLGVADTRRRLGQRAHDRFPGSARHR